MTAPDADTITFVTDAGDEFAFWTDITLSDDYLTPCQSVALSIGVDETRYDLSQKILSEQGFKILVNGNPAMTGFVDSIDLEASRDGTRVVVTGRDILAAVVDGNVDPRMAVTKEMSLRDLAEKIFMDEFGLGGLIFEEFDEGRNASVGKAIKAPRSSGKKPRRALKDPLKSVRPHDNEGAFQYFTRIAHRNGYHAFAMPDGSGVVVSYPNYEQPPVYTLTRKRSVGLAGAGAGNNLERGRVKYDTTGVPSHIFVRGKGSQPGEKAKYVGGATSDFQRRFKPFYVCDDENSTKEGCERYARYLLGKAERNFATYEVTLRGCADPSTGAVYTVDTMASVSDELCGVQGPMWIESRTLRKSRGGTSTQMKLIPPHTLVLDYYQGDSPKAPAKNYKAAREEKKFTGLYRDVNGTLMMRFESGKKEEVFAG